MACWAAIIFDPIFAFTDYLNIPEHWYALLITRLSVAAVILLVWSLRKRFRLSSAFVVSVPFLLISVQNAYVYLFIGPEHALGQNLNFMALLVGASLFVLWRLAYSIIIVIIAVMATGLFLYFNPNLTVNNFFLNGGLLLGSSAVFMVILINFRYNLTVKEIKTRLALKDSVITLRQQSEVIKTINDNLERLVLERTAELEQKNKALEEYAFLTAHSLRGPVASILGLMTVFKSFPLNDEVREAVSHLVKTTSRLDGIVTEMLKAIEKGDVPKGKAGQEENR